MSRPELPLVLVTHPRNRLDSYFGADALARLRQMARVRLNPSDDDLAGASLVEAARGCAVVIAYRQTPVDAASCAGLAVVRAIVRCAVDIRTIYVSAASTHGILVTQASAGFVAPVSEWIVGAMIDLGRNISAGVLEFRANGVAQPHMGRQLRGATLGVIGYGQIAQYLCSVAGALGMQVLVTDPFASVDAPGLKLLLVRTPQGVRAYDRRCPHRAVDLIDGAHDETQIFCPGHGIAFALADGHSSCAAFKLRSFDVMESGGKIVLRRKSVAQEAAAPPAAAA